MSFYIPIICGSTRRDRQSIKVAKFVLTQLQKRKNVETELLDLLELNFPMMEERLHRRDDPPPGLKEFGEKIGRADSFIIVTPEYNNGYPGVLKNALDWVSQPFQRSVFRNKPVSLISTSVAFTGGVRAQCQLRETLHSMLAIVVPGPEIIIGGVHSKIAGQKFVDDKTLGYILGSLHLLRKEILAGEFRAGLELPVQ